MPLDTVEVGRDMEIYDLASCNIASALLRCAFDTVLLKHATTAEQERAEGKHRIARSNAGKGVAAVDIAYQAGEGQRSFAEFYRCSAYGRFPQEHRRDAVSGLHAFVVEQQPHDFTDLACDEWVLGLPLKASCQTRFDYGDGWRKAKRSRGDVLLVPPATEVRYEIAGETKLLVVTWPEGALRALDPEIFREEDGPLRPVCGSYFKNTAVETVCRGIWFEMARTDQASRLLLDSALLQLAGSLLRCADVRPKLRDLKRSEIRRSLAFIEENLHTDMSLQQLATLSGLSMFHFAREFRAQVGQTPLRFIKERRLARAEVMLAGGKRRVEDVAKQTGFKTVRRLREALRDR